MGLTGLLELLHDPELNLEGPVIIFLPSHYIREGAQFTVFRGSFVPDFRKTNCWFYGFFDFMVYSQPTYVKSLGSSERIDNCGNQAIHYEVSFGNSRKMEQVLEFSQVDVNTQNFKGQTAFYVACCRGSWPVAQVLLSQGADPSTPDTTSGNTCLHWICTWDESRQSIFARTLIERGANLDTLNTNDIVMFQYPFVLPRGSPLHWAVATFQHFGCQVPPEPWGKAFHSQWIRPISL